MVADSERYYLELAAAFVRGRRPDAPRFAPSELVGWGREEGLRIHKFKRNPSLPRVRRVFGMLQAMARDDLVDVGSGRGTFLWPLLATFPNLRITAIDVDDIRVRDLTAVRAGGVDRLTVLHGDVQQVPLPADSADVVTILEVLEHLANPLQAARRAVGVALVAHHQVPFFVLERDDPERLVIMVSQTARNDWLALLCEADARGRIADDQAELLDKVALFAEQCRELGCWQDPWSFQSDHARFLYFRDRRRSRFAPTHDDTRSQVTVMSGLPGAGKDHWIRAHATDQPVVSLDAIRQARGVGPEANQGRVIQEARELAKQYLCAGEPLVWNATNVSRELRG